MRVPQVSERIKEAPAQALRGVFAGIGQLLLITDKLRNKAPADQDIPRARTPEAAETVTDTIVTDPDAQREETAPAPAEPAAAEPAAAEPATAEPATAEPVAAEPPAVDSATAEAVAAGPAAAEPGVAATAKQAPAKPATARRAPAKPTTAKPATKPASTRRSVAKAGDPAAEQAPKPPKPQSARDFDKTGNVRVLGDEAGAPAAVPEPVSVAEPETGPADSAPPLPNYDELSMASLRARLRNLDVAQVRQLADYERAHAARADVLAMFERRIAKLEAEG